jgi:hypothetical protein
MVLPLDNLGTPHRSTTVAAGRSRAAGGAP